MLQMYQKWTRLGTWQHIIVASLSIQQAPSALSGKNNLIHYFFLTSSLSFDLKSVEIAL